jgi:hypothetical protein
MNYQEAVDNKINGNISTWKKWLKKAKKVDILNAIEYEHGQYGTQRHNIINDMRFFLDS